MMYGIFRNPRRPGVFFAEGSEKGGPPGLGVRRGL